MSRPWNSWIILRWTDCRTSVYIWWDYSEIDCHVLCIKWCVLLGSGDINTDGWWPYNSMASARHWSPGWRPRDRWRTGTRSFAASELHSSACSVSAYWQWTAAWWPLRLPTYVISALDKCNGVYTVVMSKCQNSIICERLNTRCTIVWLVLLRL